jgi:hypothetical protein
MSVSGLWRSMAARLTGGQEVAGSNPASPTRRNPVATTVTGFLCFCGFSTCGRLGPYLGPYGAFGTLSGGEIHLCTNLDYGRQLVPVVGQRGAGVPVTHPVRQRLSMCPAV